MEKVAVICATCQQREAVFESIRAPRDESPERRARCLACWEREEAAAAPLDEQRIREAPVDWDRVRPLLAQAEASATREELLRLADGLEHAVRRYGRALPPDVAAFLERHRRSRPAV